MNLQLIKCHTCKLNFNKICLKFSGNFVAYNPITKRHVTNVYLTDIYKAWEYQCQGKFYKS